MYEREGELRTVTWKGGEKSTPRALVCTNVGEGDCGRRREGEGSGPGVDMH